MKLNKIVALLLALAMVFSLAACGGENPDPSETPNTSNPATDPSPTEPKNETPVVVEDNVSVDFEDGNFGFVAIYEGRANADASTLEVVESCGNKALKVTNGSGKVPYVAIDVYGLLGENAANVRSIEMTVGIENPDGKFYACSGNLILWDASKLSTTSHGWSVYLEKKNPKVASFDLADYEAFSEANSVAVLTLDTDNGATAGAANANLFIHNITFKDADGKVIAADSSAAFTAPEGFASSKDMSNLKYLKNTVSLDGMAGISGAAWGQNGVEMTEEFIAALVPGAVIEIEYSSKSGDMWLVFPDDGTWTRVQQQTAATNNSKSICQITYEQIAAAIGREDVSTWGARIQCEASDEWQVYSVKIGQDSGLVNTTSKTEIEGAACTGTSWGQNGPTLTEEQIALLQPGTIIEVTYSTTSLTGDLWIVIPDDGVWSRVQQQTAACDGSTMQITYEQIAAVCGDDVSQWFKNGTRIQFESDGDWEVYSMNICKPAINVSGSVDLGIAVSGAGWAQDGAELTEEQKALLVPGSAITIKYTSESGYLWIVMPDDGVWSRVEQQTAACDGETCVITYEQIAAVCGDDVSQWFKNGNRIQFESDTPWEVYSVSIGMVSGGTTETPDDGDEPTVEIPVPEIPAVPEGATELYSGTTAMSGWQMVTQVNTTVWGGTVDPAIFTDGGYFTVYFTGENVYSVHLCFNGGVSASWVQLDCEVANATDLGDGTYAATFSMADMIATYGSDMSGLGAVMVYSNSDAAGYAIVTLLTYTPAA